MPAGIPRTPAQPTIGSPTPPHDPSLLHHSLYSKRREIDNVQAQIKTVTQTLAELHQDEHQLRKTAKQTARRLSPFQYAPQDVLNSIAESLLRVQRTDIFDMDSGIWPLTHVCGAWRRSILALPNLWSEFRIGVRPNSEAALEMLEVVLERSGEHPLTFTLYMSHAKEAEYGYVITNTMVRHSQRWRDVYFSGLIPSVCLMPLYGRLPVLERLEWYTEAPDEREWTNSEAEQRIFEDAPRLRVVDYDQTTVGRFNVMFRFPVRQLREFRFTWWPSSPADAYGAVIWEMEDLAGFTSLVRLHLHDADMVRTECEWEKEREAVLLPLVMDLTIHRRVWLLSALRLPKLEKLSLLGLDDSMGWDGLQLLEDWVGRYPEGQVTEFHATGIIGEYQDGDLGSVLVTRSFYGLRTLCIEEESSWTMPWVEKLLEKLIFESPIDSGTWTEVPLPRLRKIEVRFRIGGNPRDHRHLGILKRLIVSRTSGVDVARGEEWQRAVSDLGFRNQVVPARLESATIDYGGTWPPVNSVADKSRI